MTNYRNLIFSCYITFAIGLILYISSCASVQAPTGGPRDSIPPKVLKEFPKNLSKNFTAKTIEIEFDEFIKLSNEFTEISITPTLEIPPIYRAKKENLEIKFDKPLEPNTTYTINFGQAIADVNETNILKNYTYVFATGDEIDSLSLSGQVTSALTKEKLKDVTVFILPVSQDSLFGKKRASFFTTTDTAGNFQLNNLRENNYRIYALDEQGSGDRIYNSQNEQIGFIDTPIVLNKNISNIRLQVFKAVPQTFQVLDRKIEPDGRILLAFNKPVLTPSVRIMDSPDLDANKSIEFTGKRDTAFIWQQEIAFDSLKLEVSDAGTPIDTVLLRRNKRDTYTRSVSISDNISGIKLKPRTDVAITLSAPISAAQQSLLTILEDSVQVRSFQLVKSVSSTRSYLIKYPWRTGKEYTLKFAENVFTDIYGNKSKVFTRKFSLDTDENYGNIELKVTVPDTASTYIIQWMGEKENIYRENSINKNTTLSYTTYPTGKYRIRVIYDDNKNGIWDTGDVRKNKQPEKIWMFEKIISLRPNWDLEESLTIPPPDPK